MDSGVQAVAARLVVLTGATSGIGLACAKALSKARYTLHLIARTEADLARVSDELPSRVTYSVLDLSCREAISTFCAAWSRPVWGLVNNAGHWREERLTATPSTAWDSTIRLNLDGPYFLTQGLVHSIVDGGRIVNMSSQLGSSGRAGYGAYAASKHALNGLTRCWAQELGGRQITVNSVSPGWVRTTSNLADFSRQQATTGRSPDDVMDEIARELALHRMIEPSEVAALVVFLIGEFASGITGQVYEIK